jgi:predicted O-methyltransferase YrrM
MLTIPVGFQACLKNIFHAIRGVDGWLSDAEVECLALFAACPTATGEVLEIGSFRGKSTIVLARAAALTQQTHVVAVDPFVLEGPTLADHNGVASARALFEANLRQAGVEHAVELHEAYSNEVGKSWDRPIRLLWIDGDHTYEGARTDLETFLPFLADRAIVAFHDILHPYQCVRAFREGVVESPDFGPVGFCGSIGWAQYTLDGSQTTGRSAERRKLAHRLQTLERLSHKKLRRLSKLNYKIRRAMITYKRIKPNRWLRQVA